ncbi:MAG TPA: AmmeMemoRadiSam system protein A [Caldilineae bacterium]|nr:AmmeMemoRadiSam system protein A [Caldilineae bacterium]
MSAQHSPLSDIDLTAEQIELLLQIARTALTKSIAGDQQWRPDLKSLPDRLRAHGACFVTLYTDGALHGCIGSVDPVLPLAHDVAKNAISAGQNDPRFPPLTAPELDRTAIEISILSPMQRVLFHDIEDLIAQIRPGEDGVLVERGWNRGLLLPQVWDKIADPYEFLGHVAMKAYASIDIYDDPDAEVYTFQVYHFTQPAPQASAHQPE